MFSRIYFRVRRVIWSKFGTFIEQFKRFNYLTIIGRNTKVKPYSTTIYYYFYKFLTYFKVSYSVRYTCKHQLHQKHIEANKHTRQLLTQSTA